MRTTTALPPGQHAVEGFPRFGTHLHWPPPEVPEVPALQIGGAVKAPFPFPLTELAGLPRREITADFHCVAGWSATGLRWEGVPFEDFFRQVIEPALLPGVTVTHIAFSGLDDYRVGITIEDAMEHDVLIAEHLNGEPIDGDHGAPARLVSPRQYGFINVKHLCAIDVHTSEPKDRYMGHPTSQLMLRFYTRHPRARVWHEERHRFLPARAARLVGRLITGRLMRACNPDDRH
ncbi:MAG: molybdopterin-dependent oxidoreductase [Actinobacteria bacterium]|nr:molybdopterin-dependent oxidoreductase [Actinomycetota bacterium]MBV9255900.1 molybdopterin-dependent oxidoreductase [Actinomycetota bacterium]